MKYKIPIIYQNSETDIIEQIIPTNKITPLHICYFIYECINEINKKFQNLFIEKAYDKNQQHNGYYIKYNFNNYLYGHYIQNIHCTIIKDLNNIHFTTVYDSNSNQLLDIYNNIIYLKNAIHFGTYYDINIDKINNTISHRKISRLTNCDYYKKDFFNNIYYVEINNQKFNFIKTIDNVSNNSRNCEILKIYNQKYPEELQYYNEDIYQIETKQEKSYLYDVIQYIIKCTSGYENVKNFYNYFTNKNIDVIFQKHYNIDLIFLNNIINLKHLDMIYKCSYNEEFYNKFIKIITIYINYINILNENITFYYDDINDKLIYYDSEGDFILLDSDINEKLNILIKDKYNLYKKKNNYDKMINDENYDEMIDDENYDEMIDDENIYGGNPIINNYIYNGFTSAKVYDLKWTDINIIKEILKTPKYVEIGYIDKNNEQQYYNNATMCYNENKFKIKFGDESRFELKYEDKKLVNDIHNIQIHTIVILDMETQIISYRFSKYIPKNLYEHFNKYLNEYPTELKISMTINTGTDDFIDGNFVPLILQLNKINRNGNNIIISNDNNDSFEITKDNIITIKENGKQIEHNDSYNILYITIFK
jgi:hypothetical protein